MVDLNDPMYEFVRDDPVFRMDLRDDRYDLLPSSSVEPRERDQLAGSLRRLAGSLQRLAELVNGGQDLPLPADGYASLDVSTDGRRFAQIIHGPDGCQLLLLPAVPGRAAGLPEVPRLAAVDSPPVLDMHLPDDSAPARRPSRTSSASERATRKAGGKQ